MKDSDILKAARALLKTIESRPVYLDDVRENISTPCWLLKLNTTRTPVNGTRSQNICDLYVTYIQDLNANDSLHLYDIKSALHDAFVPGFKCADRFITIETISTDIYDDAGEILQASLHFTYYDAVQPRESDDGKDWMMEHFYPSYLDN